METVKAVLKAVDGPILRRALAEAAVVVAAAAVAQIASFFQAHPLQDPVAAYILARSFAFAERVFFQAREELKKQPV